MEKILIKCKKCVNTCKMESESKARLILCNKYLSKRSRTLKKGKGKGNIPPHSERGLNQISVFENN
jgi:hypothetical protein